MRLDDRVINVECTKQDAIALSAIQSESYTLITGELGRVPSEDNEIDLGTKYLERDRIDAIILYDTLPAYCIPKAIMMETGEIIYDKVHASPRPHPVLLLKTIG